MDDLLKMLEYCSSVTVGREVIEELFPPSAIKQNSMAEGLMFMITGAFPETVTTTKQRIEEFAVKNNLGHYFNNKDLVFYKL